MKLIRSLMLAALGVLAFGGVAVASPAYYQPTANLATLAAYGAASPSIKHASVSVASVSSVSGYATYSWASPCPASADGATYVAATGVPTTGSSGTYGCWVLEGLASFTPAAIPPGGAPLASPAFTGNPTAPTPSTGDNDTSIATTAFVKAQGYLTSPVAIVNGGTGATTAAAARTALGVTATGADTTYNFRSNNLSDVANVATARSNLGVAIGSQVEAWSTYLDCLVNLSPNTGILKFGSVGACSAGAATFADVGGTATIAQGGTGATTAAAARTALGVTGTGGDTTYNYRANNLSDVASPSTALANLAGAPLASPTFTGTPAAPTPTAGDSTTKLATTAFVVTSFAPLASPTLTGDPKAPTATAGDSDTSIATTAFVATSFAPKDNPTFTTQYGGNVSAYVGSTSAFYWNARTLERSPADGVLKLSNQAETDFGRIQLGGTTTSFPAIKRNAAGVSFRLADDSADTSITASALTLSGTPLAVASGGTAATTASGARTSLGLAIGSNEQAWNLYLDCMSGLVLSPGSHLFAMGSVGACSTKDIGTDVQAWDADLDAIAALSSTGIVKRTGAGAWSFATAGTDYAPATSGTNILTGNGSGSFASFGGATCTNQFMSSLTSAGATTCTTPTLAGVQFANQGTVNQILHGNAAGNPSWGAIDLTTAQVVNSLGVGNGGTGGVSAASARSNLSAAVLGANNDITSLSGLTTPLSGAQGGTGNGFYAVAGPATSLKTFTYPNASANVLTDNAAVTVAQGGTGAGTQSGAWTNLNLYHYDGTYAGAGTLATINQRVNCIGAIGAVSGGTWFVASSGIASCTQLGYPLTVADGGIGATTLANNGVLYGAGTSNINALAVNSTATLKYLSQNNSNAPTWTSPTFAALTDTLDMANGTGQIANNLGVSHGGTGAGDIITAMSNLGRPTQASTPQLDKVNTTMSNVGNLTITTTSGKQYYFAALLVVNLDTVSGGRFRMGGSSTATSAQYLGTFTCDTSGAVTRQRFTDIGATVMNITGCTAGSMELRGVVTINAGGTFMPQFALNTGTTTGSVLAQSPIEWQQLN